MSRLKPTRFLYVFQVVSQGSESIIEFGKFPEIVCAISEMDIEDGKVHAIALDAVKHALQARIDYLDLIPESDDTSSGAGSWVSMPPLDSIKLMLYLQCQANRWSKSHFAKQIGVTATTATRLLDLFHESRFDVLMQAFSQLGYIVDSAFTLRSTDVSHRA